MGRIDGWGWTPLGVKMLGMAVFLGTMLVCSLLYLFQAQLISREKNYQDGGFSLSEITAYKRLEGQDALALSFDHPHQADSETVKVGRSYILLLSYQLRSNLYQDNDSDEEESFALYYYTYGDQLGERQELDVLKVLRDKGYHRIYTELPEKNWKMSLYSDGKDDYLGLKSDQQKSLYLNIRTQQLQEEQPGEEIVYGLAAPYSERLSFYDLKTDESGLSISSFPLIQYPEDEDSTPREPKVTKIPATTAYLQVLEDYDSIYFLKENMSLEEGLALQREFAPDSRESYWEMIVGSGGKRRILRVTDRKQFEQAIKEDRPDGKTSAKK